MADEGVATTGALLPEIDAAATTPEAELRRRQRARARLAALARVAVPLLLLAQLALLLQIGRACSITYDESGHLRYGWRLLHGDASRFDDSKMPVSALNALPLRLSPYVRWPRARTALASLLAARVPTMLALVLLTALVARWAWQLWGPGGALLAAALAALDPNLLAHGALVTTDVWIALAFTAVLYLAWRCAERPTTGRAAALLLALALAQAVKYTAVLLPPLLVLVALVRYGLGHRRPGERAWPRLRRVVRRSVVWSCAALLVGLLVVNAAFLADRTLTRFGDYRFRSATLRGLQARHPAWAGVRVPVPYPWLEGLDWVHHRERTGRGYGRIYLHGELRAHGGFRGYYLWCWLYKVPLATQALLLAAAVVAWRRRRALRWRRDLVFLLLVPAVLAVYLNVGFRAQMGVRYSLLLFPPLYVFAGVLAASGHRLRWPALLALVALVGALGASVLSWHPWELAYFDELLRDRRQAWRLLADSNLDWGQSEGALRAWRAAHPEAVLEPARPRTGTIVVRANFLTGVMGDERFAWLRRLQPVDTVAYSYLVFEVKPEDLPASAPAAAPHVGASAAPR